MFGQFRQRLDPDVHHVMETVRQVVSVPPVDDDAFHALSVIPALAFAAAVVFPGIPDLGKELVLKPVCLRCIAAKETVHRLDFQFMVVYHTLISFTASAASAGLWLYIISLSPSPLPQLPQFHDCPSCHYLFYRFRRFRRFHPQRLPVQRLDRDDGANHQHRGHQKDILLVDHFNPQ
jgi:hypothetical protein